jgi:large subunit ribosomal protein L30
MAQVKITQVRSLIKRPHDQKDTMKALGFKKMHQTIVKEASPQVMGMVNKVAHLLKVEMIDEQA